MLLQDTLFSLGWALTWLCRCEQVNQQVTMSTFKAFDVGGSITIHAFGAYYGLSASLMLSRCGPRPQPRMSVTELGRHPEHCGKASALML